MKLTVNLLLTSVLVFLVSAVGFAQGPAGGRGNRDPEMPRVNLFIYSDPQGKSQAKSSRPIYIDDREVGTLRVQRYFLVRLFPGKHTVGPKNVPGRITFELEPGQDYFVSTTLDKAGSPSKNLHLRRKYPEGGAVDIKKLKKSRTADVKDHVLVDPDSLETR
jgi:hypothetical protein